MKRNAWCAVVCLAVVPAVGCRSRPPPARITLHGLPPGQALPGIAACVMQPGGWADCDTPDGVRSCYVVDRSEPPQVPFLVCGLTIDHGLLGSDSEFGSEHLGSYRVVLVPDGARARLLKTRAELAAYLQIDTPAKALTFVLAVEPSFLVDPKKPVTLASDGFHVTVGAYYPYGCNHPYTEREFLVTAAGGMTQVREKLLGTFHENVCAD